MNDNSLDKKLKDIYYLLSGSITSPPSDVSDKLGWWLETIMVQLMLGGGSNSGGGNKHNFLSDRNEANAHPISAITELQSVLDNLLSELEQKADKSDDDDWYSASEVLTTRKCFNGRPIYRITIEVDLGSGTTNTQVRFDTDISHLNIRHLVSINLAVNQAGVSGNAYSGSGVVQAMNSEYVKAMKLGNTLAVFRGGGWSGAWIAWVTLEYTKV